MARSVITVADVYKAAETGTMTLSAPLDQFLVTPSALEKGKEIGVAILREPGGSKPDGPRADAGAASSGPVNWSARFARY